MTSTRNYSPNQPDMLASRRKSCIACVKAKRRCDLGLPACRRCATRPSKCVYPWAEVSNASTTLIGSRTFELELGNPSLLGLDAWNPQVPQPVPETEELALLATIGPLNQQSLSPVMSTLIDNPIRDEQILFGSFQQEFNIADTTADRQLLPRTAANPEPGSESITTGSIFQARTEYAARRLSLQPLTFIKVGQTAFLHHKHVAGSTHLQEAFAASALFAMQNATNAQMVTSEVDRRAAHLISTVSTELSSSPFSSIDLLAPAQALLVYQCIRLFSSNIHQHSQAERDESYLLSWISKLRTHISPFDDTSDWSDWVREESIRRTVLIAEVLCGTYAFLKQGWDQSEARVMSLSFTAQAALWEARSRAEWKAVWIRGPKLEVQMRRWDLDMILATPENAEELGVIIRATFLGLDALEEWLGGQKEGLVKWGLRP